MTTREDILSLADKLVREADDISRNLTAPGWRPTRSRIEDARNLLRRAAALLAVPAPPAAEAPDLPWRRRDIERGLILFRTSSNAHGSTNVSILSEKVDALPQSAKEELAGMMRNIASGLSKLPAAEAPRQEPVALTYTNWRGETHTRRILPLSIWYGKTEWHLDPQWFLRARDVERGVERDFALKDLGSAPPAPKGEGQ